MREIQKLSYLDSLRGIAILGVFLVHSTLFFSVLRIDVLPLHLEKMFVAGQYGVALFFLISSFSLMRSLEIRSKYEKNYIKNFYIRRFFRIAPLYYFILLVINYVAPIIITSISGKSIFDFVLHIIFLNGFVENMQNDILRVEWSIGVEFFFYFLLPYIFLHNSKFLFFIVSSLFLFIGCSLFKEDYFHFLPLKWLFVFMIGCALFKYKNNLKIYFKSNYMYPVLIILFILLPFINFSSKLGWFLYLPLFVALLLTLEENASYLSRIFHNRFFTFLGKFSFSLYLVHMPIIGFIKTFIIVKFPPPFGINNNPAIFFIWLYNFCRFIVNSSNSLFCYRVIRY